jgi:acyl-CoA reductase-like NAD-dependent aldehyde dehydrogenase
VGVAFEETFGPVATVIRIKDEEEALQVSCRSGYGFDSRVVTNGYRRVWRIARDLCLRELAAKDHPKHGVAYFPVWPQQGERDRPPGDRYGIDERTELKTIVFNLKA